METEMRDALWVCQDVELTMNYDDKRRRMAAVPSLKCRPIIDQCSGIDESIQRMRRCISGDMCQNS